MSRKNKILLSLIFAFAVLMAFGWGYYISSLVNRGNETLSWVMKMIDQYAFVYDEDTGKARKFTTSDYANAMISGLIDIYSGYYDQNALVDQISTSKGNRYGTGISVIGTEIYWVAGNSPGEKAGLKEGQIITAVEYGGQKKEVGTVEELFEAMNAVPDNVRFNLYVEGEERPYSLAREVYVESCVWYYDSEKSFKFIGEGSEEPVGREEIGTAIDGLDGDTAYVIIKSITGKSAEEFSSVMEYMKERRRHKLILDLRKNGGGNIDILAKIAGYLIDDGNNKKGLTVFKAVFKDGYSYDIKTESSEYGGMGFENIVVLADGASASATESLIGAMIHYGTLKSENLIITGHFVSGREVYTTYGKGIMQTTYSNLKTGEGIKLTTAYVYWPDGETNIHGKGIAATVEENMIPASADLSAPIERAKAII